MGAFPFEATGELGPHAFLFPARAPTNLHVHFLMKIAMPKVKNGFLRLVEISLYGHGVLHFAELGFALYEEAYITASLAGFGALTMVLGAVFLGRIHHH